MTDLTTFAVGLKKPLSLAQTLAEAISGDIRAGRLKPGDKLPTESAIMAQHDVSRTVVREAMSYLQAEGLVQTRHGVGTFVLEAGMASQGIRTASVTSLGDMETVLELRMCLETEAAWLAASRRTPEQLEQLRVALEEMRRLSGDRRAATIDADVTFHQIIAQSTGNRYFVEILHDLGNAIIHRPRVSTGHIAPFDPASYSDRVIREHEDIFHAIERRDAEVARAAMRTHLSNSCQRMRQAQEDLDAASLQAH